MADETLEAACWLLPVKVALSEQRISSACCLKKLKMTELDISSEDPSSFTNSLRMAFAQKVQLFFFQLSSSPFVQIMYYVLLHFIMQKQSYYAKKQPVILWLYLWLYERICIGYKGLTCVCTFMNTFAYVFVLLYDWLLKHALSI